MVKDKDPNSKIKRVKTITSKKMVPTEIMDPLLDEDSNQVAEIVNREAGNSHDQSVASIDKPAEREAVLSIVGGVTTQELKQALEVQTEQRKLIQEFIKENLVEDVDYGKIHVVKNCQAEDRQRGSCDKSYHYSKSILFKPGQEKIFSLFGITDELVKDHDAYEMLEDVKGLVAYKCVMHRGDKRIGEGRGAATLAGSQSDPNSTIKKAEKRARMDACLSLGFSAYFTQDLDDPEYAAQREMMNSKAAAEAGRIDKDQFGLMPRDKDLPINDEERQILSKLMLKKGFSQRAEILEVLKVNGVKAPEAMTSGEAREMMSKLSADMFSAPEKAPEEDNSDDTPTTPEQPSVPKEPELVVDDEFRNEIANRAELLELNARGQIWLMKRIAGKPFAKFESLTDDQWRNAYDVIQGIMDGTIDVEYSYFKKSNAKPIPDNVDPETGEIFDPTEPTNQAEKDAKELADIASPMFPVSDKADDTKPESPRAVPANG